MKKSLKKVKGKTGKKAGKNGAQQVNIDETKDVSGGAAMERQTRDHSQGPR
jgi:hypothetical protein